MFFLVIVVAAALMTAAFRAPDGDVL